MRRTPGQADAGTAHYGNVHPLFRQRERTRQ
jgi:hypothetical protein